MILEVRPHVAIGVGIFAAFMSESMIQASAKSHLRHKATSLESELNIAIPALGPSFGVAPSGTCICIS